MARPATLGAAVALQIGLASGLIAACGQGPRDFATADDARRAQVFAQGLLPDVLPPSAALIRIDKDPQDGSAEGYFHFSSGDYPALIARLQPLAARPADPQVVVWIQRKQLADYTPFEVRAGARAWLFLCAQNKGRCYFRSIT